MRSAYGLARRLDKGPAVGDDTGIPALWVALGVLLFGLIMLGTLALLSRKHGWEGPEKERVPAEKAYRTS